MIQSLRLQASPGGSTEVDVPVASEGQGGLGKDPGFLAFYLSTPRFWLFQATKAAVTHCS